tara:strand:- start:112 stop:387 length:276 start_codon:yes stop_codon:yes gene_type:complete
MNKREKVYNAIKSANGLIFSIEFVKADNTKRKMVCRSGVKKHLNPNGKRIKTSHPLEIGKMRVFDLEKNQYRFINLDNAFRITINGKSYEI